MQFQNISHRTISSYQRLLSDLTFVAPEGMASGEQPALEESERALHGFFHVLYDRMAECPELFGLPLGPDDCVEEDQPGRTQKMAEMNRKLRKTQGMVESLLDLIRAIGKDGQPEGQSLALDIQDRPEFAKQLKAAKKLLAGLETLGVRISAAEGKATLISRQFPAMLPALTLLAAACAGCTDAKLGRFCFARCDFRALNPGYIPDALDLFRVFEPADRAYVARLHEFFTGLKYRPIYKGYSIFGWEVEYQGNRKIKASPLYMVQYDERFHRQLRMQIKCASAIRLVPIIGQQSAELQADFFRRANTCQEDKCRWCDTRPQLGPSVVEYKGERRTICWYINPDVRELNDSQVDLIQQYALMHETLN